MPTQPSLLNFVIPEATTNLLPNPSFETGVAGYTANGGAGIGRVAPTLVAACRGGYILQVTMPAGSGVGVYTTVALTAGQTYTWSLDVTTYQASAASYILRVENPDTTVLSDVTFTGNGKVGAWQRPSNTFTAGVSGSHILLLFRTLSGGSTATLATDGWQVEAKGYATSYCDGDQPGCTWAGIRHASLSTRSAQYRGGGRSVDPLVAWNAGLVTMQGTGLPPVHHVSTDYGQVDGAEFQRVTVKQRPFTLTYRIVATSIPDLHAKRLGFINAVKKDLVSPEQPVRIQYVGGTQTVEIDAYYDDGFQMTKKLDGFSEELTLRFLADDPYWKAVYTSSKALLLNEPVSDAAYILERWEDGTWHSLAGGLNGTVFAAVYGQDGYLYVGGAFTIAYNASGALSPVTVNRVARWDGTQWSAMGAGFNGQVNGLTIDGAGNVYAGGLWTDAAYPHIAKWNGTAWSAVGSASAAGGNVNTVLYNPHDGRVWIGGSFTSWNSVANQAFVAAWNTTSGAYDPLLTGANTTLSQGCIDLAYDRTGSIVACGDFTQVGGQVFNRLMLHKSTDSLTTWTSYPSTASGGNGLSGPVAAVAFDATNTLFVGGSFGDAAYPFIAKRIGNTFVKLGSGVNNNVYTLNTNIPGTILFVGGLFTKAGGLTLADKFAYWTGSAWAHSYVDLPGSATVWAHAQKAGTSRIAIGFDTTGTATTSNITDTTVTVTGSREAAPAIVITGPGTVLTVQNTTTGKVLTFNNLTLQAGEYMVLSLDPINFYCHSNLRGNLTNYILPGSDVGSWRLQPGANTVLVKASGTTAASGLYLVWRERWWSIDQ